MKNLIALLLLSTGMVACSAPAPRVTYTEYKYRVYREPVVSYREYRVEQPPTGRPVTVRASASW